MQAANTDSHLVALLDWYRAMGVETAAAVEAIDWLSRGNDAPGSNFEWGTAPAAAAALPSPGRAPPVQAPNRAPLPAHVPTPAAPRTFSPQQPGVAETAARQAARGASSLPELGAALAKFEGCSLKATAKNLCFYRGAAQTRLMLIGEAPGRDEDLEGKPFVGRTGQLLDRMLAAIGLGEGDVHMTNIVYWRPPGNRTPAPQEAEACRPFLERQVELVAPDMIVLLGGAAANQVLGVAEGIMRLRGRWQELTSGVHTCRAMATLHPAYLLLTPAAKRLAWRDLLAIKAALRT